MSTIPTEPIGSIPRPESLIQAVAATPGDPALDALYDAAVRDTIVQFEATGSPVITDGEQRKYHNFWTYCVQGLADRVLQAAEYIPLAQLGTCDDCGFAPFCDDTTTTRETAFAKIRARVEGTAMASARLEAR